MKPKKKMNTVEKKNAYNTNQKRNTKDFDKIETIDFQEGPPLYFLEVRAPCKVSENRFAVT